MTDHSAPFDPSKVTLTAAQWDVLLDVAMGLTDHEYDGGTVKSLIERGLALPGHGRRRLAGLTVNGTITLMHRERPSAGKHTWESSDYHQMQVQAWEKWKQEIRQNLADRWG